jgi:hypothetical protein
MKWRADNIWFGVYRVAQKLIFFLCVLQKAVLAGGTGFIDPRWRTRSEEERRLAEVIEQCFTFEAIERPSIFEVVGLLRHAVEETLGKDVSRAKILQEIP